MTQDEIVAAIRDGQLQYRENHIHGNPYLRLLRAEVEALVTIKHGPKFLAHQKLQAELKSVKRQIRSLTTKTNALEKRQAEILNDLNI